MSVPRKSILFIMGPLDAGGAERVLIDVLRHFDYEKFDVDLAVLWPGGKFAGELPSQVRVLPIYPGKTWMFRLAFHVSRFTGINYLLKHRFDKVLGARRYDCEISFMEGIPLKFHGLRRSPARRVSWVHLDLVSCPYERRWFFGSQETRAYESMDTVVCVAPGVARTFPERFHVVRPDVRVMYNPVDVAHIEALSRAYTVPRKAGVEICSVARVIRQKNPVRFVEMARELLAGGLDAHFTWVGDGDLLASMRKLCHDYGLEKQVEFIGFRGNPYPYMLGADVVVSSSDVESLQCSLYEAVSLSRHIAITPAADPAVVIKGVNGAVSRDFSAHALAEAVVETLGLPSFSFDDIKTCPQYLRPETSALNGLFSSVDDYVKSLYALLGYKD